jgi:hypothetical protein
MGSLTLRQHRNNTNHKPCPKMRAPPGHQLINTRSPTRKMDLNNWLVRGLKNMTWSTGAEIQPALEIALAVESLSLTFNSPETKGWNILW